MTSAICTLFEGDYHYGVGALCNSLFQSGYQGVFYAGYRGQLPPWASSAASRKGYSELTVAPQFVVRFVPLRTEIHFVYYKPTFMLSVWRDHCPAADSLFYFDPDITSIARWSFFEEWVEFGVAICADINAEMSAGHPLRQAWAKYYQQFGIQVIQEQNTYFNSGFVGVSKRNSGFLHTWQRLVQLMEEAMGGMPKAKVRDRTFLFNSRDQDAMNAATMACHEPISSVGRDGMDLRREGGGYIMAHALGISKPWRRKILWRTIVNGQPPGRADKAYFRNSKAPIRLYGPLRFGLKKLDLLAGSALGRFIG